MEILNQDDVHLKFLLNSPIYVDGIGNFLPPSLKDIIELTESSYNTALTSAFLDKSSLEKSPEDIDQYTDFQVLNSIVFHDVSYRDAFFCALNLHFNKSPKMHESGYIYFDELNEDTILTDEKFNYIKMLIKIANNLQSEKEEEIVAGNERAREFMNEQKRKKAMLAKLKKPKVNLHSIISAVGWKAKSFDFISQLNIYQLYDGYGRFQLMDNYFYTMSGIYSGTIDGSKIKPEDINWANIFQKN